MTSEAVRPVGTEIRTERLLVRPFRPHDWRDLLESLSLPATYRFEPGDPIDAAWRVLEKAGLEREGHLRSNVRFRRGRAGLPISQDTLIYGRVNPRPDA